MTNPVSQDRELARMLVDKCDTILDMFYENARDALGSSGEDSNIDTSELMDAVENINSIRELRNALVAGHSGYLFSQHKHALTIVLEMSLDMES